MSVKIAISQPGLPAYRAPVFQRLANTPGIELSLFAGDLTAGQREVTHLRGASVIPAPTRHLLSNRLFTQPEWSDLVRANRFDLVILPWNIRYANLLPTLNAARRNKVPVVLWGHGYSKHRRPLTNAIRNHLGRRADAVLVYTRTVARHLIEHAGFNPSKVFVAQNAIDQTPIAHARQHWLSNPTALGAFQNEHRLDPRQTLIFVSRLNQENRVELLLYGLQKLHATHPAAKLVVVGHGPEDTVARLHVSARRPLPRPPVENEVHLAGRFDEGERLGLALKDQLGEGARAGADLDEPGAHVRGEEFENPAVVVEGEGHRLQVGALVGDF